METDWLNLGNRYVVYEQPIIMFVAVKITRYFDKARERGLCYVAGSNYSFILRCTFSNLL